MKLNHTLFIILFFAPALLFGQNNSADRMQIKQFGIGMGIDFPSDGWSSMPRTTLMITYNINNLIRLEPEIGISIRNSKLDDDVSNSESVYSDYTVALSSYGIIRRSKTAFLIGVKFGYNSSKSEDFEYFSSKYLRTTKDLIIGPILGLEYFFNEHFSINGDLFFKYQSGNYKVTPFQYSGENKSFSTVGGLNLHFFF